MRSRLLLPTSLVLVLATFGPSGHAQDRPVPVSSEDAEARGLFEAGRAAFVDGRFEDARDYFQRAYELSHRPELLYNLGTAEDRLRNDHEALAAFERYLAALPDAANATEVHARVEVLRAEVARTTSTATSAASEPAPLRVPIVAIVHASIALALGGAAIGTWVAANDAYQARERGCFAAGGCGDDELSSVQVLVDATNGLWISALIVGVAASTALGFELGTPADDGHTVRAQVGIGSLSIEGTF